MLAHSLPGAVRPCRGTFSQCPMPLATGHGHLQPVADDASNRPRALTAARNCPNSLEAVSNRRRSRCGRRSRPAPGVLLDPGMPPP
eukprot:5175536-Alexandrium_andersonii.AAC.1